jgi:hypothetical protein
MTEVEFHEADYYYFLAPIFAKSTAPWLATASWTDVAFCLIPGAGLHYLLGGAGCTGTPCIEYNFIYAHELGEGAISGYKSIFLHFTCPCIKKYAEWNPMRQVLGSISGSELCKFCSQSYDRDLQRQRCKHLQRHELPSAFFLLLWKII